MNSADIDYTTLAIVVVAFFTVAPLLWLGILWMASRCGWRKFAAGRECPVPPEGVSVNVVNTLFRLLASYNNATIATFTPDGFHLRTRWPLKVFHPAFFVPWDLVTSCQPRPFFFITLPEFQISDGSNRFFVRLSRANYQRVKSLLPERLQAAG